MAPRMCFKVSSELNQDNQLDHTYALSDLEKFILNLILGGMFFQCILVENIGDDYQHFIGHK